jgi:NSS family neurotransmitter:Na+ symporter
MTASSEKKLTRGWSSRAGFLLAAIGGSIGLGNLWRFPYQAGESGGAAFILVYIVCIVFVSLPVVSTEIFLGRRGGYGSAVHSIQRLAKDEGAGRWWQSLAILGIIASTVILSFYSVVAGWVVFYAVEAGRSLVTNIQDFGLLGLAEPAFKGLSPNDVEQSFSKLLSSPLTMIIYHTIFISIVMFVVGRGIQRGIEVVSKWLMPSFFVMLIILSIVSLFQGNASDALSYLFKPDFSALGTGIKDGSLLQAGLGQAFFSVSLGSAMLITYGAYLSKKVNIQSASVTIVTADTLVALLAGMAIFPIVFQFGLEPAGGPGLMFISLPLAFQQMPFGALFGLAFFLMALFAALTSGFSLLAVPAAWFEGKTKNPRRRWIAVFMVGGIIFFVGMANALSQVPLTQDTWFNSWIPLKNLQLFEGRLLMDTLDQLTNAVLLPLSGFLTALFAGWAVSSSASKEELNFSSEKVYKIWFILIRYVCPIAIGIIFVYGIFIAPYMTD